MKTLGIDLGPNSIGWALVEESDHPRLIDVGVRVFPEGVDNYDTSKELSRNEQRRNARMMRRQILRRRNRKRKVSAALVEAGLLPTDPHARQTLLRSDPFALRQRALIERLDPYDIGRVIYHLNQRRGFLSLRKTEAKADKEVEGMLAQINELERRMAGRTLGQTLFDDQHPSGAAKADPLVRLRGQHTRRSMIEGELLRIWEFQSKFHPELLSEGILYGSVGRQSAMRPREPIARDHPKTPLQQFGVHGLLFHQRPIYWPRSMIGACELEKGKRRCARADRAAQWFRILQEVNNLRYIDPGANEERALNEEQRKDLVAELAKRSEMTFDQVRRALGLVDSVRFNLERGDRSKLKGHETDSRLSHKSAFGPGWHQLAEKTKDGIVRELIHAELNENEARERLLAGGFGLTPDQVERLLTVQLPSGYVRFSLTAIEKLLPHLERGLVLMGKTDAEASALHAAGYLRRDELTRRIFERELPPLNKIHSGPLADLANPVVKAALYQLRKVVNAIVRAHGKPDAVHIEMARSIRMGLEARRRYNQRVQERGRERDEIARFLRENGVSVTRDAITKYQLWKQQGGYCIYSGTQIGFRDLFDGAVHVDHILPRSQTLDDSQMNKVVCLGSANDKKRQRSPYQWLASDPDQYNAVLQRAQSLPFPKRQRFIQKELDLDDFIQRQLVDTGYISRLAVNYLQMLIDQAHQVQGRKGQFTAELRHQWGLETVLEELPDSPAWHTKTSLRPGEKNRADHRHHAIDAIVVALTNRSRLQHLARMIEAGGVRATGEALPEPWPDLRDSVVARVKAVNISHAVRRGVRGALHEDTFYGPVRQPISGKPVEGQFVVRKPVESLSLAEIERVRDKGIRDLIIRQLGEAGIVFGRGQQKSSPKAFAEALADLHMTARDGRKIPIRRVRVLKSDLTIRPIRAGRHDEAFVRPGATHHLCLFEWEEPDAKGRRTKVRGAVFVTMLEARQRIKLAQPVIQKTHPSRADARFIMSLSGGELVLARWKGCSQPLLLTFKTAASTQGQIYFALHTDGRRSADQTKYVCNCNTIEATKVTVDPLGRIRWAND